MEQQQAFSWLKELPGFASAAAVDPRSALRSLRDAARTSPMRGFELELVGRLLKTVARGNDAGLPVCRVALLAATTPEPIANAIRVALLREGLLGDVYEAPFGAYRQEIIASTSELYAFRPDLVVIAAPAAESSALPQSALPVDEVDAALERETAQWRTLWAAVGSRLGVPVLQHIGETPEHDLLGVAERRSAWTPARYVAALNERLIEAAPGSVRWVDVDRLAARVGRQNWHDPRLYHHAKIGFSSRFLPEYAELLGGALRRALARPRKALILDLDNTLWGGVIGDDQLDGIQLGPDSAEGEAYAAFCRYVKDLGRRGIILGICSKNDPATAAEVFDRHPHMPLSLDDFAITVCNWGDKATNLAAIARDLNIDPSAIVFVDDNAAECELIRRTLPEVHTVLMDGDPAGFVARLDQQRLFDADALSREDLQRGASYRARARSAELQVAAAGDLDSYLASLEMRAHVRRAAPGDLARLAQMEMKTNQFNLSTRRLAAEQIEAIAGSPDAVVLVASLADRFADHGIVSYLAATRSGDTFVITDWLMSCRVFSRTLEHFLINHLAEQAAASGVRAIVATFTPTAKNGVMAPLFETLGFECAGAAPAGPWRYGVQPGQPPLQCFVADASSVVESAAGGAR